MTTAAETHTAAPGQTLEEIAAEHGVSVKANGLDPTTAFVEEQELIIPEEDSLAATPLAANPHVGYRGDIDGEWGNTDDYGVYAEALAPHLESHGFAAEVSYGADPALLQAELDAGRPVIVWIGTRGDIGFHEWSLQACPLHARRGRLWL